jgi:voltage-dependent anion channel protein 2
MCVKVICVFSSSYNGWVCGVHGAFDTAKSKLTNTNIAIGYKSSDFVLHSSV